MLQFLTHQNYFDVVNLQHEKKTQTKKLTIVFGQDFLKRRHRHGVDMVGLDLVATHLALHGIVALSNSLR
jgi:hypothetical protein